MLNEIIMLADNIINETEVGVTCFGIEAVSHKTGEVKFDFFGDYVYPRFVDGKLVREKSEPVQTAFKNYPLAIYSVTFHGLAWARQKRIEYMLEKLDELEERAALLQNHADDTDEFADNKWRAEKLADIAFGNAWRQAKKIAELYQQYANVDENLALRAVAQRKIDYSRILG